MIIQPANRLGKVEEYYFSKKLKEIRQLNAAGKNIINIGIGSPDLAPSKETIKALTTTAEQKQHHGYQGYVGIPALREAIATWYDKIYAVAVDSTQEVLPLMGSKEGIMHISMAFLNAGDGVLVPNPGYPTYSSVSRLLQAQIHTYDLDENKNWQPKWEELEKMDLSNIKIMWVNYPNMPTGADATQAVFEKLVAFGKKHNILIINDNPYSLILNKQPKSILQIEGAKEVALELNSLSKSHNMAGWRVGMLLGKAAYLQTILRVKSNMDSGMFRGIQEAAVQALQNPITWHDTQNEIYANRRKVAFTIMDMLGCTYNENQVGMFVWAKIPNHIQHVEKWVDDILYKAEVFITPGFIFGTAGERYIRLSLCSEIAVLETVKERLLKTVCKENKLVSV